LPPSSTNLTNNRKKGIGKKDTPKRERERKRERKKEKKKQNKLFLSFFSSSSFPHSGPGILT